MPRYIDADFLEKEGWSLHRTYHKDKATIVYEVKAISEINTADVRENVHGEWRTTDAFPHWLCCTKCYKRLVPNVNWVDEYNIPTNFCPNCGADMRFSQHMNPPEE